jgi:hypothetical protein
VKPARSVRGAYLRSLLDLTDEQLQENVRKYLALATRRETFAGRRWYSEAHTLARQLRREHGLRSIRHAAGVIAALSPATSWVANVKDAHALCSTPADAALPTVSTYRANLHKAAAIRYGARPERILGGAKVRAFYACIAAPTKTDAVCIDRHAVMAALDRIVPPKDGADVLDIAGAYQRVADAYRAVAAEVGWQPHQVQAVVWLAWRRHKVEQRRLVRQQTKLAA